MPPDSVARDLRVIATALMVVLLAPAAGLAADTPPADFTIAFIGDQDDGTDAEAVLQLILNEGADAIVHSGDFDYGDNPAAWDALVTSVLGEDFPYFASCGNHDVAAFYGPGGYQELQAARLDRLGIGWNGDLGVASSLTYRGVFIVLTAPDVFGDGDTVHAPFIRNALIGTDAIWRISSWHKNMHAMQAGAKGDSTGWGVYEESRLGGAIIATAHEHSYSRTHLLSNMESQTCAALNCAAPPDRTLVLLADDPATPTDEGRSFAFVSGLGGFSIRDQENDGPWFASIYTSTQGADFGALFGVFNYQGNPRLAYFYFKDLSGVIADEFFVLSMNGPGDPMIVIEGVAVVEGDVGSSDAVFDVTLLSATGDEVRVDYATTDGSATAGDDYEPVSGQLVFSGEVTIEQIHVSVNGDGIKEGDETFFLALSGVLGAELGNTSATGTILGDDGPIIQFTLAVQTDGLGTVTSTPPGGVYDAGTGVSLLAEPVAGHSFAGWSGDLQGVVNPETIVIDGDKTVTATFVPSPQPGLISLLEIEEGGSSESNSVATNAVLAAVSGDLYLAVIASKPNARVMGVSGMELAWSPVRAQCAGRDQTGVSVWMALGNPVSDEVVTATFDRVTRNTVIAVARYSGAEPSQPISGVVSVNTLGLAGGCVGGTDANTYNFDLAATAADSRVIVAVAMRKRDHMPGPDYTEQREVYQGTGGDTAGVSIADRGIAAPGPVTVDGTFNKLVDFAATALEIRPAPLSTGPFGLEVTASSGGHVDVSPPTGPYDADTVVTLTALPDVGFAFAGWSGDATGTGPITMIVMNEDKSVTASFVEEFSVAVSPGTGGTITLDPSGGVYARDTLVTVHAMPDPGYSFEEWGGDLSGSATPATLLVDADKTVLATFELLPTYSLGVTASPGGQVDVSPPTGPYDAGTGVTLTALPDAGFAFVGWSGDAAGTDPVVMIVMNEDKSVTASFVEEFSVAVSPGTGGAITLDPSGGVYARDTLVTVHATPDPGYSFEEWGGDLSGSATPTTLLVDTDKTVLANFELLPTFSLGVTASPGGQVDLSPPSGPYAADTEVTLSALPDAGFAFAGWSGDVTGTDPIVMIVMNEDKSVTASFAALPPPPPGASFEEIQTGGSPRASSVSTAAPITAVSGDLYLAAISSKRDTTVTDVAGIGLTWNRVLVQCAGRSQTGLDLWAASGTPSGDGVVTATLNGKPKNTVIAVARYSGAAGLGALLSGNTQGVSGACRGGTDNDRYAFALDTTEPGSTLFVAVAILDRDHQPGADFSERATVYSGTRSSSIAGLSIEDQSVATAGTASVDGMLSSNSDWAVVAVEILAAP